MHIFASPNCLCASQWTTSATVHAQAHLHAIISGKVVTCCSFATCVHGCAAHEYEAKAAVHSKLVGVPGKEEKLLGAQEALSSAQVKCTLKI